MFRAVALVAAGIVFGFVLGGVGPRRELEDKASELEELKRRADRGDRPNPLRALLPQLVRDGRSSASREETADVDDPNNAMAAASEDGDEGREAADNDHQAVIIRGQEGAAAQATVKTSEPSSEPEGAAPGANPTSDKGAVDRPDRQRGFGQLTLSRFDELSDAQALRFAASRSALIEQAGLNDKETAAVDQTVKKMNDDLSGYGEEILSQATSDEAPTASQALGLGHDVSGIMYEGQKQLEGIVGDRAEGVEPKALEIWNYVDMKRLRPAAEKYLPAGLKGEPTGATGGASTGGTTGGASPKARE